MSENRGPSIKSSHQAARVETLFFNSPDVISTLIAVSAIRFAIAYQHAFFLQPVIGCLLLLICRLVLGLQILTRRPRILPNLRLSFPSKDLETCVQTVYLTVSPEEVLGAADRTIDLLKKANKTHFQTLHTLNLERNCVLTHRLKTPCPCFLFHPFG